MKPRRPCTVCGKWTTAIYMHMVYSHDWTEEQVNELKTLIKEEQLLRKGSFVYECYKCGIGCTSSSGLAAHVPKCKKRPELKRYRNLLRRGTSSVGGRLEEHVKDKQFMWSMEGGRQSQPKQLPPRPPVMPPLPDQMSESEKGSVICPVPRCGRRFTNHDSLSYHCMIEHSELGAAGTPQNFAIRQYRFENKEEYKEWLYERCEQTCTSFSTKTSMWSGYAMYRCNRAGTFKTSGTIRAGTTTKKAQSHCSAFLRISEYSDGSLDVTCCFGHIFHELDPTALRLNERQCGVIRKLLEEKKFLSDICKQMKKDFPPTNRLHYTSTNDIRNLALRLGLPIHLKDRRHSLLPKDAEAICEEHIESDHVSCDEAFVESEDDELTAHSEMEQEDELDYEGELVIEEPHEEEEDHSGEHDLLQDVDELEDITLSTPSPSSIHSSLSSSTEIRPMRTRRAPRRFGDD